MLGYWPEGDSVLLQLPTIHGSATVSISCDKLWTWWHEANELHNQKQ